MKRSFSLFGITLYPYSLFMVFGVCVCLGLFTLFTVKRRTQFAEENVFAIEMLIISAAVALPIAMVVDSLFKWGEIGQFVIKGATFYGGMLGAMGVWVLLLQIKRNKKVSTYQRLCDLAPCIPLGHCFGRVGCFLGGCCFGSPTDCPFGVIFPQGSLPYEFYGGEVAIHPTQLYEACALCVIFVLLILCKKELALPLYFISYGVVRFLIELLRSDDRGNIFQLPLSPAQMISLLLIAVGGGLLIARAMRRRQSKQKREN